MAQLLDNFVTGPLPEPGTGGEMCLYHKTRKGVSRNGKSGSWVYDVDRYVLVSTSRLFFKQFREDIEEIEIIWPESCSLAVYFDWFYTRVVKRITDADRSKYQNTAANNILKWPRHSLKQYAPLVKDIHLLISLWILGEFVEDDTFRDTVIDILHQIIDESNDHGEDYNNGQSARDSFLNFLAPPVIRGIWSRTRPGAKLRAFVIDHILIHGTESDFRRFNMARLSTEPEDAVYLERKVAEEELRLSKLRRSARLAEKSAKTGKSTGKTKTDSYNGKLNMNKFTMLAVDAGAEDPDEEEEPIYVSRYPPEFVKELNVARGSTLLVSELPKHIGDRYHQERVFLPLPPYHPQVLGRQPTEVIVPSIYPPFNQLVTQEAPPAMSLEEMSLPERDRFLRFVYGKGQVVFRSTHVVMNEDMGNSAGDTTEFAGLEIRQPKLSCIYHEHVGNNSCYRLGHQFHMCEPTPYQ